MTKVTVLGGIEVYIKNDPSGQIIRGMDNPGRISMRFAGPGFETVEGLCREEADVYFCAAVGNDLAGRAVKAEVAALGANGDGITLIEGYDTAASHGVFNIVNDLEFAFSNHDIYEKMEKSMIERVLPSIKKSDIVSADTTLPLDIIEYIRDECRDTLIMLDVISEKTAAKTKEICGSFDIVKADRQSAEVLSGMEILSQEQLEKAGAEIMKKGMKKLFITLGPGGIYYRQGDERGTLHSDRNTAVSDRTKTSARLIMGCAQGLSSSETAEKAIKE